MRRGRTGPSRARRLPSAPRCSQSVESACALFEAVPKANLALITVAGETTPGFCASLCGSQNEDDDAGADIAVVRRYLDALRTRGAYAGSAVHIGADNLETIGRAFEEVSAKMADNQKSVL